MIKRSFFLFFTAVLLSWGTYVDVASGSFPITHTQDTPGLEPASLSASDNSFKVASVCFLGGNCGNDGGFNKGGDDYEINTANQCEQEKFVKLNCNSAQQIDEVCPYNSNYGKKCVCRPDLITCPAGQVGVGPSCGGKYLSCQCDSALVSCPSNKNGQGVTCGGKYQSCICKPEYQYTSSNCTSPRSLGGTTCQNSKTQNTYPPVKYTRCSCPFGVSTGAYGCQEYYPSPCSSVCKIAYSDNCHNRTAMSCQYGCAGYFADCPSKCSRCYTDNCRNRTDITLPDNAVCTGFYIDCLTKCSTWVCKDGYKKNTNLWVTMHDTCVVDPCYGKTAVMIPANAYCSQSFPGCSSKCSDWECNDGYSKVPSRFVALGSQQGYVCQKNDPCDTRTDVPVPANAYCMGTYMDCPSKCSLWACNDGYTKVGNSCVKQHDPCDDYTAVTLPTNAYCSASFPGCPSKCSEWACNDGYSKQLGMCIKSITVDPGNLHPLDPSTPKEPTCGSKQVKILCSGQYYCCKADAANCYYTQNHGTNPDGTMTYMCTLALSPQ